jgi:hypothetical protein
LIVGDFLVRVFLVVAVVEWVGVCLVSGVRVDFLGVPVVQPVVPPVVPCGGVLVARRFVEVGVVIA